MKPLSRLLTAFLLITMFSFNQCKKNHGIQSDNPYGLPNATQTGANMFACRVNGVNWISGNGITLMGGGVSNDTLSAHGETGDGNYFDMIEFTIQGGAVQGGQYNFNITGGKKINFETLKTCNGYLGSILHQVSTSGTGLITKIDKTNKIISGTFNCKIPIATCDTLNITDGRFDINYY